MGITNIEWTDCSINPIRARLRTAHVGLMKGGYGSGVGHYCEKVSRAVRSAIARDRSRDSECRSFLARLNGLAEYLADEQQDHRVYKAGEKMGHRLRVTRGDNVWLGASCENQQTADERIPHLLKCPATVRFLSCEPLLGAINLDDHLMMLTRKPGERIWELPKISWVIVGGESGPHARPMHPDWARSIRDQCGEAGVSFFFKQWGEHIPADHVTPEQITNHPDVNNFLARGQGGPATMPVYRVGKKAAGRMLDGRTWDEFPEAARAD